MKSSRALVLFAVLSLLASMNAQAQQLFFSEDSNGTGLYTLDTNTAAATNVGDSGVTSSTVGLSPSGTTGTLFGTAFADLLEIPTDGSGATVIGGDGQEGLAYDPVSGTLYGAINGAFTTVDPATGLDQTTLAAPGADVEGIAWGNGGVYGIAGNDSNLYFYDPGTDSWSTVGATGVTWDDAGLAFDPGTNTLYAKGDQDSNLYSIDPATASSTLIGDTGIAEGGGLAFTGLGTAPPPAPPTTIPVMGGFATMLLAALLALIGFAVIRVRG